MEQPVYLKQFDAECNSEQKGVQYKLQKNV